LREDKKIKEKNHPQNITLSLPKDVIQDLFFFLILPQGKFFSSGGSCLRTTQELRSQKLTDMTKHVCKPIPRTLHPSPAWAHTSECFYLHKSDYLQSPPRAPE